MVSRRGNDAAGPNEPGLRCVSCWARCLKSPAQLRSAKCATKPKDEAAALAAALWQRASDQALSSFMRSSPNPSKQSVASSPGSMRRCTWSPDTVQTRAPTPFVPIRHSGATPSRLTSPQTVLYTPAVAAPPAENNGRRTPQPESVQQRQEQQADPLWLWLHRLYAFGAAQRGQQPPRIQVPPTAPFPLSQRSSPPLRMAGAMDESARQATAKAVVAPGSAERRRAKAAAAAAAHAAVAPSEVVAQQIGKNAKASESGLAGWLVLVDLAV